VETLLGHGVDGGQPGVGEGAQVLGRLRLAQAERCGDLVDRAGSLAEQLDDLQPDRVGQCAEYVEVHARSMPTNEYSCQGILLARV
jgi:hypothetical protein